MTWHENRLESTSSFVRSTRAPNERLSAHGANNDVRSAQSHGLLDVCARIHGMGYGPGRFLCNHRAEDTTLPHRRTTQLEIEGNASSSLTTSESGIFVAPDSIKSSISSAQARRKLSYL